ncbi:Endonuclease/exonuclease/phosphatase [Pseudocohnilembus persalinus]|uniref:Endonuclease/exonuclease/phosphatase n=1 Tax=Pseudocohnilembus persalinus TaxID=266149 RepID=A0A0V0R4I0_PSEPJ|nr:Endonuclease/exonuclease/phosphatase [Pseudocohnilembus persalinus]|eukprot:KRX09383.1 Endonuclease/exonuclease/phosphatase [Pseudocohnilembus persalinus]
MELESTKIFPKEQHLDYYKEEINQKNKMIKVEYNNQFKYNEQNKNIIYEKQFDFTIMTYNILADYYEPYQWMVQFNPEYIKFEYRRKQIIERIKNLSPDIICLQEVDEYESFYKQQLENLGYISEYQQKDQKVEGILIGVKKEKFKIVEKQIIKLNEDIKDIKFLSNKLQKKIFKPQVAMIIIAEVLGLKQEQKQQISICNTHLFWDPKQVYCKYLQACHILDIFNNKLSKDQQQNLVFCGDLNSIQKCDTTALFHHKKRPCFENILPSEQINVKQAHMNDMQKIYDHYINKFDKIELETVYNDDFQIYNESKQNEQINVEQSQKQTQNEQNGTILQCTEDQQENGVQNKDDQNDQYELNWYGQKKVRPVTCFHPTRLLNLDYIYFNKNSESLKLEKVLKLPNIERDVLVQGCNFIMPNKFEGSDHFPLMAEFSILSRKQ